MGFVASRSYSFLSHCFATLFHSVSVFSPEPDGTVKTEARQDALEFTVSLPTYSETGTQDSRLNLLDSSAYLLTYS